MPPLRRKVKEMTNFGLAMQALGADIPTWAWLINQTGNLRIISRGELILRFGDMSWTQTDALRQDIADRLTIEYKKRMQKCL